MMLCMIQILRPLFVDGDIVCITNDRKKAIKAQNSIGSEWSDGIIDVSVSITVYRDIKVSSITLFPRYWVKKV